MNTIKSLTLSALFTAITFGSVAAQAQPVDYRLYSPNIEVSQKYKLNKHTHINKNKYNWVNKNYRSDYRQDNLNANLHMLQKRNYSSGVSQGAANVSGNVGNNMNQKQGATTVSTRSTDALRYRHGGLNIGSPSGVGSGGPKGNFFMDRSQIGGNQSGLQAGDNTSIQANNQRQHGQAYTGSLDYLSNSIKK
ncbi:hypothetical protein [Marinobacterium jannaschii]|uniref:hypothetical protein n=1 Tax=Marinobacterium jannaschii TaxID=64970 RepID=UPI0004885883|nr:hypothetical protein [Marinobacterium jannaschii]